MCVRHHNIRQQRFTHPIVRSITRLQYEICVLQAINIVKAWQWGYGSVIFLAQYPPAANFASWMGGKLIHSSTSSVQSPTLNFCVWAASIHGCLPGTIQYCDNVVHKSKLACTRCVPSYVTSFPSSFQAFANYCICTWLTQYSFLFCVGCVWWHRSCFLGEPKGGAGCPLEVFHPWSEDCAVYTRALSEWPLHDVILVGCHFQYSNFSFIQ